MPNVKRQDVTADKYGSAVLAGATPAEQWALGNAAAWSVLLNGDMVAHSLTNTANAGGC